jgi:hypothetical protein
MKINNKYIDWQPITNKINDSNKLTILELGCGVGTSHLLEHFKFVYSYETNTRDTDGRWFNLTEQQHKNKNWIGFFDQEFPDIKQNVNVSKLIYNISKQIDLDLIDVVFIDPGFKNRAECVVEFACLNKFEYIFTHDTNTEPELYNWAYLKKMPNTYRLYAHINTGQGTMLWKKI